MATLNGVPFRKMLVPASKYKIKCPYLMKPKKITFHNTDNEMPAENEIRYMISNNNMTSYHFCSDEKETIQGLPLDRNGWHAGDGGNGYGNRNTIGWEIARNYDRKRRTTRLIEPLAGMYNKAELNAIKSAAQVYKNLGLPATVNTVAKHQDWSGKNCPSKILNESRWNAFQTAVIVEYRRLMNMNNIQPSTNIYTVKRGDSLSKIAQTHKTTVAELVKINGIKNPNIISIGQKITLPHSAPKKSNHQIAQEVIDGKWGNNPQRAQKLKAAGYNASVIQQEVNKLVGSPKKSITQMAKEVIDGKHGNGHTQRQKSLKISAAEYAKVRQKVNQML